MAIYNNLSKIGADLTMTLQYANTRPTQCCTFVALLMI